MHYPLSSVHKLIFERIHPEAVSQTDSPDSLADTWQEVKQEIEVSRLHVFSQLSQANGNDSLKIIVYTCQAGYVSLIKRLGFYIRQSETCKTNLTPIMREQYTNIRQFLIVHLNELYKEYFPFFDSEQQVPKCILMNKQYKIRILSQSIQKQLSTLSDDQSLIDIVYHFLDRLFGPEQPDITYKQFHYLRQFVTELNRYCFSMAPFADSITLSDFLIKKNFNEPAFIKYIMGRLHDQVTEDMAIEEQAEKWAFHVKEFNQITIIASQSLYPQWESVKASLINAAEQELFFLKQKISLLNATQNATPIRSKEKQRIATDLTVSQLGVFMRLLVDCKLVQHPNQTELLKLVAGSLTTTKTTQISAESLRVRYYNPDRASLAITKEYLLQMLKQLNQY